MTNAVGLRDVIESDVEIFFAYEADEEAAWMAAFSRKDPGRDAFDAHWKKVLEDDSVRVKTILWDGEVAGSIFCYLLDGQPQIGYWIGKPYWGRGIATQALTAFLAIVKERPVYARAAADNLASLRVLEKCGFRIKGYEKFYANVRQEEIEEAVLVLGEIDKVDK